MITKESIKSFLWWTVFIILAIITYYQLSVTINGWNSRPFDEYVESANKQDVPFPSVTVCPSGITIWSGLQKFLNEMEFKPIYREHLQRSYKTFLRLKLGYLAQGYGDLKMELGYCRRLKEYLENRELCNFFQYLFTMGSRKLITQTYKNDTLELIEELKEYLNYDDFLIDDESPKSFFLYLNNYLILHYSNHINIFGWMSPMIDAAIIDTIENPREESATERVLKYLHEDEIVLTTTTTTTDSPFLDFLKRKKRNNQREDNLEEEFIRMPNTTLNVPSNMKELLRFDFDPIMNNTLIHQFSVLKMLENMDFSAIKNLGDFLVPLMRKPLDGSVGYEFLSPKISQQTKQEITDFLIMILRNITQDPEITWSIIDAVEIFLITGQAQLKTRLMNKDTFTTNTWWSLTESEKICLQNEFEVTIQNIHTEFKDPCVDPLDTCKSFCKNSAIIQNQILTNQELQKLLYYVQHPSEYNSEGSWLVSFCGQGKQAKKLDENISPDFNSKQYGYELCKNAYQRVTDIGICTTIEFDDKSNTSPPPGVYKKFKKGMSYMFDSFAFFHPDYNREVRSIRDDTLGTTEHEDTILEKNLNSFLVLLHNKEEFPMFHSPFERSFVINSARLRDNMFINEHILEFDIKQKLYDPELMNQYNVETRRCLFKSESKNSLYSPVYTQAQCIYECKLSRILELCKCLPWFVSFRKENTTICNIFGNKCYEQALASTNEVLDFTSLDSPACNCYPDCEATDYIPGVGNEDRTLTENQNQNLIDLTKIPNFDWGNDSQIKEFGKDKFLFPYVRDAVLGERRKLHRQIDNITGDVEMMDILLEMSSSQCSTCGIYGKLKQRVTNLALLHMDFRSTTFMRTRVVERISFGDKVGSAGGLIGLFLGFSFIGLVDALFWIIEKVSKMCHYAKK